jgi:hypothetical protein
METESPAPSPSTLKGKGAGILIGGTTLDGRSLAALEAVLSTWTDPTADLNTRVTRLRSGPLAAGRVASNKQPNTLEGGAGPNLFFAALDDSTKASSGDADSTL